MVEPSLLVIGFAGVTILQIGLIASIIVAIVYLVISFSVGKEKVQKMLIKKPTLLTSTLLAGLNIVLYTTLLLYTQDFNAKGVGSIEFYKEYVAIQGVIVFIIVFVVSFLLSHFALWLGFKFSKKGFDYKHVTD